MNVKLHYTVDGPADAPLLVLGSSLGTTSALWQPQVPALSERFRLVRYDHRGHGHSPVPPGPYAIEELGQDVIAMLDAIGAQRVHLGGVSLGGMVAMWVAANAPERIDRLVLICTSSQLGPASMWAERAAIAREQGVTALADAVIERWFTPGFRQTNAGVVAWTKRMLATTPAEGYAGCCGAIETMDLNPHLSKIVAPTLVIAGADDPATPPAHAEIIRESIPDARMEVVPDAAHMAAVQQPAKVSRLMIDFLS